MRASDQIKAFIKIQEGFSGIAYKPLKTDVWTVGYGFTCIDGEPVVEGETIDKDFAVTLLSEEVDRIALKLIQKPLPEAVTQRQFDAVLSLVYNIGFAAFLKSNTGILFYQGENISNRFPFFSKSGGKEIKGLKLRRLREQLIYDKGVYGV